MDWINDYLGPFADEVTDEQKTAMVAASDAIDERWPEEDLEDMRQAAFSAAVRIILGDDTIEDHAAAWADARRREAEARSAAYGAIIAAAQAGTSERSIAETTGLARDTVRKALGK